MIRTFLFLFAALAAAAADYVVVANPGIKASDISGEDLKRVFLGMKTSLDDGSPVEPVLAQSGAPHDAFLKTCVGKSDPALRNHFKSLVFTGKGNMPKSLNSDADIVAYVAKTKGAIGYVSPAATAASVKKLSVK